MDEKMNSVLKGIYDSLTEEQKEKAKDLKTVEEMTEFAAKEGIELPDDMLNAVAGGGRICGHGSCDTNCSWNNICDHGC